MSSDNKNVPIDYNVKEIIDNLDKKKILTPEDKKRIEESLNFEADQALPDNIVQIESNLTFSQLMPASLLIVSIIPHVGCPKFQFQQ